MSYTVKCVENPLISFRSEMFRTAMRFLGNTSDAEDAVQDACLRLLQKDDYNSKGYGAALCCHVVRNICIDRLRTAHPCCAIESASRILTDDTPLDAVEYNDTKAIIGTLLAAMPTSKRRIMLMRIKGYSYAEIAATTGLTTACVRVLVSRLRREICNVLN